MGTSAFSYLPSNSSDLTFNTWVDRFLTALSDVGLTQTADTGQQTYLGSPLAPLPGSIDTSAGYQIWRTPVLTAGSPSDGLYLKFGFGTGNQTSKPAVFLQVGTGSDGSGNLTGAVSGTFECYPTTNIGTPNPGPCYFAAGDWGFWFTWGITGLSNSDLPFDAAVVLRSVDGSGIPNDNGYIVSTPFAISASTRSGAAENNPQFQCGNTVTNQMYGGIATSVTAGDVGSFCYMPCPDGNGSDNNVASWVDINGNAAVFPMFGMNPHPFPTAGASGWVSDLPWYSTFTATPVGTTQRNYISMDPFVITSYASVATDETYKTSVMYCLPWE